jgi:hypothetical protein
MDEEVRHRDLCAPAMWCKHFLHALTDAGQRNLTQIMVTCSNAPVSWRFSLTLRVMECMKNYSV